METTITFTELTSKQGPITKVLTINPDGTISKKANATLAIGTGKTIKLPQSELQNYLQNLNSEELKVMVLGIWKEATGEYDITTQGQEKVEENLIYRGKEYFSYCNSDQVGLMLLDIDGNWPQAEINSFLAELDAILYNAVLPGEGTGNQFAYWSKPSSSYKAIPKGTTKTDCHIYIPVKNPKKELIEEIFKFAWMRPNTKGHKFSGPGVVLYSILDPGVKGPERLVFESDPVVVGDTDLVQNNDRTCSYRPGGVIDSEMAISILRETNIGFNSEKISYVARIKSTPEYDVALKKHISNQTNRNVAKGMPLDVAEKLAKKASEEKLFSIDYLEKSDGSKVRILDILLDRDTFNQQTHFNDYSDPKPGRNVGIIQCRENGDVVLWCQRHSGIAYKLLFDYGDFVTWLKSATADEIDENIAVFAVNCEFSEMQWEAIYKQAAKTVEVGVAIVRKQVKKGIDKFTENRAKETPNPVEETNVVEFWSVLDSKSTHQDVASAYINHFSDFRTYGGKAFVWNPGNTIWEKHERTRIKKTLGKECGMVTKCTTGPAYEQITRLILEDPDKRVESWKQEYGIPCSDGFYKVGKEGVDKIAYTKELGCRYKIKFKPDSDCPTPYFDMVLANIENKELYQQLFGLLLSGYLRETQTVAVFYGTGGSGKGVSTKIMKALLTGDRVTSLSIGEMNIPEKRSALVDAVINIVPEVARTEKNINTNGLKMLTGGDTVSARYLHNDAFTFEPTCCHLLEFNDWPRLDPSSGEEIRRRVGSTIVKFDKNHTDKVLDLAEKIIERELPGVLAWAIKGIEDFLKVGGFDSAVSLDYFELWMASSSPIDGFLEDCCTVGDHKESKYTVRRSELWKEFKKYCLANEIASEANLMKKSDFFAAIQKNPNVRIRKIASGNFTICGIKLGKDPVVIGKGIVRK